MFNEEFAILLHGLFVTVAGIATPLLAVTKGFVNGAKLVQAGICCELLDGFCDNGTGTAAVEFVCTDSDGTPVVELVSNGINETAAKVI